MTRCSKCEYRIRLHDHAYMFDRCCLPLHILRLISMTMTMTIKFPYDSRSHTANLTVRSRYIKACGRGVWLLVRVRLHAVRPAALPLRECWPVRKGLPRWLHRWGAGSDERVVLHSHGHLHVSIQQARWEEGRRGWQCSAVGEILNSRLSWCSPFLWFCNSLFSWLH